MTEVRYVMTEPGLVHEEFGLNQGRKNLERELGARFIGA
jgi:hypothetical protein